MMNLVRMLMEIPEGINATKVDTYAAMIVIRVWTNIPCTLSVKKFNSLDTSIIRRRKRICCSVHTFALHSNPCYDELSLYVEENYGSEFLRLGCGTTEIQCFGSVRLLSGNDKNYRQLVIDYIPYKSVVNKIVDHVARFKTGHIWSQLRGKYKELS